MLVENYADRFVHYLEPGEKVLWTGRPPQGLVLRAEDAFLIPFSLFFLAFAVWIVAPSFSFPVEDTAFLLIGSYLAVGRFVADAHFRSTTYYAVTNSRILVIGGFRGRSLEALDFPDAKDVVVRSAADGSGTVQFGPAWPFVKWHSTYFQNPEFYRTVDAEAAADLIRNRGSVTHVSPKSS